MAKKYLIGSNPFVDCGGGRDESRQGRMSLALPRRDGSRSRSRSNRVNAACSILPVISNGNNGVKMPVNDRGLLVPFGACGKRRHNMVKLQSTDRKKTISTRKRSREEESDERRERARGRERRRGTS